jgi:geranylgeranyl transferase type-1 subunit beta
MEPHKMTILYFIVAGLKILNGFTEIEKELCVRFVIKNAVIENKSKIYLIFYQIHFYLIEIKGFRGGNFAGFSYNEEYEKNKIYNYEDKPHIAATYCALSILKMCDYDLINKSEINNKIKELYNNEDITLDNQQILQEIHLSQNDKGQISAQSFDTENDVRFLYCALCIHKLLGLNTFEDISNTINAELSLKFLDSISNYEGGFSINEGGESNAGTTYCAVACYALLGKIDKIPNIDRLIFWLMSRTSNELGVNGRTNKIPDSCYSYWVLGSLSILGQIDLVNKEHITDFLMNCQTTLVI